MIVKVQPQGVAEHLLALALLALLIKKTMYYIETKII